MNISRRLARTRKLITQCADACAWYRSLARALPPFLCTRLAEGPADKLLLLVSMGWYDAKTEALYAKALEALGYRTQVITRWDPFVGRIFALYGIDRVSFYDHYTDRSWHRSSEQQARELTRRLDEDALLCFSQDGIAVGAYAASSFMKKTRANGFVLTPATRELFCRELQGALTAVSIANKAIRTLKPDLTFVVDRGYTPVGQIFDACIRRSIPVIQRISAHKSGFDMIKRYPASGGHSLHPASLSPALWDRLLAMPWHDSCWHRVREDLERTYQSGDWFSEVGTQFNKILYTNDQVRDLLRLDPRKKTAVVFAHMFWDATFFGGTNLFRDYYEWFTSVLKVAAENDRINWLIKIHPANTIKARRDNITGAPGELVAAHQVLGTVPPHIRIIPPESEINTFSLFSCADYALTVRGTVGIEAPLFGIATLTAGTGRYDRRGFTYDFDSARTYLDTIGRLEELPPMTPEMIERARRFAYGLFIVRPLKLDLVEHGFRQDAQASMHFRPLFTDRDGFERSSFVTSLRSFVLKGQEDFINEEFLCAGS